MTLGTLNFGRRVRVLVVLAANLALLTLAACGGGGGSDSASQNITIRGVVDDGGERAISNSVCRFVDNDGQTRHTSTCDQNGNYQLSVPAGIRGYIYCSPPSTPELILSTYGSTMRSAPGSAISDENITPSTTVAADIIRHGVQSVSPEAQKLDLILKIQSGEDPDLNIVVAMATRLYQAMLAQQINAGFVGGGRDGSDDGGGDGRSDGGGVGGDAGDGADFSPLPEARCTFSVGSDLDTVELAYPSAMADYLADGELDRPDLAPLADAVNDGLDYSTEEIQNAFNAIYPQGMGQAFTTVTDAHGSYFLPVPANMPGFVRCAPLDHPNLALVTYVPARGPGAVLDDQDVTPATTVFSTLVVPQISGDLADIKENYLADIDGLTTWLSGPNLPEGPLTGIALGTDTQPANSEVGMVAFSATALFNSFYKNGLDADFTTTIKELSGNLNTDLTVDPDFLQNQGLAAEQAQMVSDAIQTTGDQLNTALPSALATARVNVTVMDTDDGGRLVENAVVDIPAIDSSVTCQGCLGTTDANGQITLTLINIQDDAATEIGLAVSSVPGFDTMMVPPIEVVALATVDLEVRLSTTTSAFNLNVQGGGEGGGRITSAPAGIDCATDAGVLSGDASAPFAEGTEVILTATPDASSAFNSWSGEACASAGATCTLNLTADTAVTAIFAPRCVEAEYTVEVSTLSFQAEAGTGTITVTAPDGCPWSATSDAAWVEISPGSGSGPGTAAFTVEANEGPFSRTGIITISGQSFTATQSGVPDAPEISNARFEYHGDAYDCVDTNGDPFTGHYFTISFDYRDPNGDAHENDNAYAMADGSSWSEWDTYTPASTGEAGEVSIGYCTPAATRSVPLRLVDGAGNMSNELVIELNDSDPN